MKFTDDYMIAQYNETSTEGDSSSYGNEDTRTPSKMGNDKKMEEIVASAVREKVIHGVDHNVDFPSIYDVDEMDDSNNQTITAVKNSTYHPASEELDVKSPATKKVQDVVLEDLVPSSTMSPPAATNIFGISEQLSVSQDVNTIHVFNDNDKSYSQESKGEEHPRMM